MYELFRFMIYNDNKNSKYRQELGRKSRNEADKDQRYAPL